MCFRHDEPVFLKQGLEVLLRCLLAVEAREVPQRRRSRGEIAPPRPSGPSIFD